jgi:putative phosphoribosyl transferase
MVFENRNDAAQKLIPYLEKFKDKEAILLAIPRGGIAIAFPVAKSCHLKLDLLMTKKIGHPKHEEFAVGAVNLEDHVVDNWPDVSMAYADSEINKIRQSLKERYKLFMGNREPLSLENKIVIIVDDGIATGHTILSAIKMLRKQNPEKIVVAVPVAPLDTAKKIRQHVDEFICLYTPPDFHGVGQYYTDFTQVSDEEVIAFITKSQEYES